MLLDDYTAVTKSAGDLKKVQELMKDQTLYPAIETVVLQMLFLT